MCRAQTTDIPLPDGVRRSLDRLSGCGARIAVAFDDVAHTMTIVGIGLDNGLPVTFTAIAVDNGQTALDTFSLTLSDGYTNTGNLLDGNVTLF